MFWNEGRTACTSLNKPELTWLSWQWETTHACLRFHEHSLLLLLLLFPTRKTFQHSIWSLNHIPVKCNTFKTLRITFNSANLKAFWRIGRNLAVYSTNLKYCQDSLMINLREANCWKSAGEENPVTSTFPNYNSTSAIKLNSRSVMSYFSRDGALDGPLWKFADVTFCLAGPPLCPHQFAISVCTTGNSTTLLHLLYWAPSGRGHLPF